MKEHNVVVLTTISLEKQLRVNEWCHNSSSSLTAMGASITNEDALVTTLDEVRLGPEEGNVIILSGMRGMIENLKEVDDLDITEEGSEAAMKGYDGRIDRFKTKIIARLKDQFRAAKNANEKFRIFTRFNVFFPWPHIRGAIRKYQTQHTQRIEYDIETLHKKFEEQGGQ